jgi:hypothetical protein
MERAVLKRLAPLLFLLGLLVAAGPSATATAADGCSRTGEYDDKGHEIVDCSASENTESTAEEVGDPRGSGSGTTECWFMGELLPSCKGPNGSTWNGTCYQGAPLPQFDEHPPEGLQIPEDGRWHECHAPPGFPLEPYGCPSGMGNNLHFCWWVPAGTETPAVDPVDVAWMAVTQMALGPIEVGIVPKSGEDRMGLVGLPTWMWVDDPIENTWGPITRSASSGPVSVNATARARQVLWDMGDGNVVACGKGIPYDRSYGIAESPNCGHRYERTSADQPDEAYHVVATTQWVVEWSGGGMTGTIELDIESDPVPIRVGEMQVLVQ